MISHELVETETKAYRKRHIYEPNPIKRYQVLQHLKRRHGPLFRRSVKLQTPHLRAVSVTGKSEVSYALTFVRLPEAFSPAYVYSPLSYARTDRVYYLN